MGERDHTWSAVPAGKATGALEGPLKILCTAQPAHHGTGAGRGLRQRVVQQPGRYMQLCATRCPYPVSPSKYDSNASIYLWAA